MATVIPTSYLAGLRLVTSDGSGAASAASFASSTQYLCIPMSSLPELTETEANPSTGDIRKIIFAFEFAIYDAWTAIASADRPTTWVSGLTSSISGSGSITRNFVHQIRTGISGEEVADEPA